MLAGPPSTTSSIVCPEANSRSRSGKYVLLKLWSPTHDGNIDIESVQFHGYSGPRFFPAMRPC